MNRHGLRQHGECESGVRFCPSARCCRYEWYYRPKESLRNPYVCVNRYRSKTQTVRIFSVTQPLSTALPTIDQFGDVALHRVKHHGGGSRPCPSLYLPWRRIALYKPVM